MFLRLCCGQALNKVYAVHHFPRLLLLVLAAAVSTSASAGPLYRWVDDEGKVHYGDQPPPEKEREQVELKFLGKGQAPAPEAAGAEPASRSPEMDLLAPDPSLLLKPSPERCAAARQRLEIYTKARQLERPNDYGQREVVSDAEREKYIAGAREEVKRACAGQ